MNLTRKRPARGKSAQALLTDTGIHLESAPVQEQTDSEDLFPTSSALRNIPRRFSGWSPASAPIARWSMPTDQAPLAWPFTLSPSLPQHGALMGFDHQAQARFYCDPIAWILDESVPVTNGNIIITGKPGTGKSGHVKTILIGLLRFKYRALIMGDLKNEYESFCRLLGVEPLDIGPGMIWRINPLDIGPLGQGWEQLSTQERESRATIIFGRWLALLRGIIGVQRIGTRAVPFTPTDEMVLSYALKNLTHMNSSADSLRTTTIPELHHALNNPSDDLIKTCRYYDPDAYFNGTRMMRDALGKLVQGSLKGMFDNHTNIPIDWKAPIQSLSARKLKSLGDEPLGIGLMCLQAWGDSVKENHGDGWKTAVVNEECWRPLRLGIEAVKSMDARLRLQRDERIINVMVMHKPGDLLSAGDTGSQAQSIAEEFLSLADIKVFGGQEKQVASQLGGIFDLPTSTQNQITGWAAASPGRAVWRIGPWERRVTTKIHPLMQGTVDTNQQLTP